MVATVSSPTVHGSARPTSVATGVGNADSDGPKSARRIRFQNTRYCSSGVPLRP